MYKSYKNLHTLKKIGSDSYVACLQKNKNKIRWILGSNKMPSEEKVVWMLERFFQMTARNYDVLKMIQIRVSELL